MPDAAGLDRLVPPYWPPAIGQPTLIDLFRSPSNPPLGWSKEVFEGGVYQAPLPGAVLVIGDADMAAEILFERFEDFPHGEMFDRLFRPVWGKGIFVSKAPSGNGRGAPPRRLSAPTA